MSDSILNSSPRINRLSLQLANQIAAGEVVERPASVVKELMENALDAGSTSISVDIVQGGLSLIRVRDNGRGINQEDMHLAVSRHATSKLNSLTELENIASLGFRGEALASISSVSRLALHSKSREAECNAWCIDTGNETDFANYKADLIPSSLPDGTMLEVRDLFFNTPARRKFLRSEKTEFRYIEDVFKRIAMSFFEVSFQLTHNKKLIKKLPAIKNQQGKLQRLQKLFGAEFCQAAISIDFNSQELIDLGIIHLWGWVANPNYLRHQANQQYFYVNGRFVRDKLLNHAIRQVFQDLIPSDKYAAYVLYLDIDPCQVDVNVHPTKHEVRFRHSRMIHDFIVSALNQAFATPFSADKSEDISISNDHLGDSYNNSYKTEAPHPKQIQENLSGLERLYANNNGQNSPKPSYQPKNLGERLNSQAHSQENFSQNWLSRESSFSKPEACVDSNHFESSHKEKESVRKELLGAQPLAIINSRFFVAEMNAELWLIDLDSCLSAINELTLAHAVQGQQNLATQRLLIPENMIIKANALDTLQCYQEQLREYGIEFTLSGPESIMLRQIAKLPFRVDLHAMFANLVEFLSQHSCESEFQGFSSLLSTPVADVDNLTQDKKLLILNYLHEYREQSTFRHAYKRLASSDLEKLISTP